MAKAAKETKIAVTLAKGACLSSATETKMGGDTLEVGLAQAARMHDRGMIEPLKGKDAKTLAEYIAAQAVETAEAQAPAQETAQAPAQDADTAQDDGQDDGQDDQGAAQDVPQGEGA